VKYSYIPAGQVADLEPTNSIVEYTSEFKDIVEQAIKSAGFKPATPKETHTLAELSYCFRIVQGFQNRLKHYDDDPAYAVDLLAVEISQTQSIPDSKNLTECRCTDGSRIWRIVTNIQGLKTSIILPCAVLPPVDMMNVVSEAMFLDGTPLPDSAEPGILKDPLPSALDQARAQVLHITKRMI
jgi:predicted RNA-binding protein with EMAP domain